MSDSAYEGIRHTKKGGKPTYIMIPRKLVMTWLISTLCLFVLSLANFQYTNYVDRRSNGFWCGIVVLFDDTYKKTPPPTEIGRKLAKEFGRIRTGYNC